MSPNEQLQSALAAFADSNDSLIEGLECRYDELLPESRDVADEKIDEAKARRVQTLALVSIASSLNSIATTIKRI